MHFVGYRNSRSWQKPEALRARWIGFRTSVGKRTGADVSRMRLWADDVTSLVVWRSQWSAQFLGSRFGERGNMGATVSLRVERKNSIQKYSP